MKKLLTTLMLCSVILLLLCIPAHGRKVYGKTETMIGTYSGAGAGQAHNIKASLDLAHTDLDAMITYDTDTLALLGQSTGGVFYCDSSGTGTTGVTWATAVNDLDVAIALCTGDAGDIIIVAPGHAEAKSAAGMLFDADVAGITIIGLGAGRLAPTFSLSHADANTAIGADDVTLKNLRFFATVTVVKAAICVEAGKKGFVIEDCVFEAETHGTDEFVDAIIVRGTASDYGVIKNCLFDTGASSNSGPQSAINFIDSDYLQIVGNKFFGDHAVACIQNETTASNFVLIDDNVLFNGIIGGTAGLNAQPCITLLATTTGVIRNNSCFCNVATPDLAIKADDCMIAGNTYCEAEGRVGSEPIRHLSGTFRTVTMASVMTATSDNMFDVAGGAIEIVSLFGQCTTNMGTPGKLTIEYNADAGTDYDGDFTTTVDINAVGAGDIVRFTGVVDEGVPTLTANVGAGEPLSWFCPEGMIEQTTGQTGTGAFKWYMTYRALDPNVTVTPQ